MYKQLYKHIAAQPGRQWPAMAEQALKKPLVNGTLGPDMAQHGKTPKRL
jgi:hypothetical protein